MVILDASLKGIGACPGPITTAFSSVVGELTGNKHLKESVRLEGRSRGTKDGAKLACEDDNGAEMAETGVNVSTKEGKVNLPEDVDVSPLPVKESEAPVATDGSLNACATGEETAKDDEATGEEPGCNAASTPGKAFPIARATASAIASTGSEIAGVLVVVVVVVVDCEVADVEGNKVEAKLLLVERGFTMIGK